MIVEAVTWREVRGRQSRRRNPSSSFLKHRVPAEIREVSTSAIVEAARVTFETETRTFYGFEGRFISRRDANGSDYGEAASYFTPGQPTKGPAFSAQLVEVEGRQVPIYRLPETLEEVGVHYSEIVTDNAQQRSSEIARSLQADYVIADGRLWRAMPEPVLAVIRPTGSAGYELMLTTRGSTHGHWEFRLDRLTEAQKFARELSSLSRRVFRDPAGGVSIAPGFELGDDRTACAVSLARQVVEACPNGWLGLLPRKTVEDWASLRTAIAAHDRAELIDADTLAGRCGEILRAIDALQLNRFGDEDRNELTKKLRPPVKRWRQFEGGSLDLPSLEGLEAELISEIAL